MIDTHVHLNDKAFNKNLNEIIQGALDNGINKMIVIGYNYKSSLKAIEIAKEISRAKGKPTCEYDVEKKAPYLLYPDGHREYDIGK